MSLKDNTVEMGMASLAVVGVGMGKNVEREKETLGKGMAS
jgi:hypothetical protein